MTLKSSASQVLLILAALASQPAQAGDADYLCRETWRRVLRLGPGQGEVAGVDVAGMVYRLQRAGTTVELRFESWDKHSETLSCQDSSEGGGLVCTSGNRELTLRAQGRLGALFGSWWPLEARLSGVFPDPGGAEMTGQLKQFSVGGGRCVRE